jgi:predicted amidohydrolase
MKFKIAVVQFRIKQHDPETNLARVERFLRKAKTAKAGLVVFPEGLTAKRVKLRPDLADRNGAYVNRLRGLARKYALDLAFSLIRKTPSGRYLNTAFYLDKRGRVLGAYDKVNLWFSERGFVSFGEKSVAFNTRFGRFGLSICWDLFFPELYRDLARKGAQVVLCPAFWQFGDAGPGQKYDPQAEVKGVNGACVSRAFENEIIFVFCNAAGPFFDAQGRRDALIGRSQICVPFKGTLKRLDHNREAMFVQEVDTSILAIAEKAYSIRSDLKKRPYRNRTQAAGIKP